MIYFFGLFIYLSDSIRELRQLLNIIMYYLKGMGTSRGVLN